MQTPTSPIKAVTVSNIANVLCAPHGQNDAQPRTVKRIQGLGFKIGADWGFGATGVPNGGANRAALWPVPQGHGL